MQGGGQNDLRWQSLEDHVLDRIKHFAVMFAQELVPGITQQQLDLAFSRALYSISAQGTSAQAQLELRFSHNCRYLGCVNQDCALCKNNPNKTCAPDDNFDEAYADNQVLKARCEAEIYVELVNQATGEVYPAPGVEVQLSVIDGDAYNSAAADPLASIVELHTSDEGVPLLQCFGANRAIHTGTVVVQLQSGRAKLPDVFITDKNDTFHFSEGSTTGHFRLLALAMRRDELGNPMPVEGVGPAVSNSFVVKTQRALNDYRKSAYPHYKDELTRLRYIGAITATRLKDARAWLGKDVPLECVDTVQSMKQLLEYVDTNRQVEDKLLALLNMRGRHRHKWEFLRSVLAEKVVYDDNKFRVWYAPGSNGCGLLYATKQAQILNMDKPAGVAQRVVRPDGSSVVQVMMLSDIHQHSQLLEWRRQAEAAWRQQRHPGWQVLQEEIDHVTNWPAAPARIPSHAMPGATVPSLAAAGAASAAPCAAPVELAIQQGLAQALAAANASNPAAAPAASAAPMLATVPEGVAQVVGSYPNVGQQQLQIGQLQQLQGNGYPAIGNGMHEINGFGPAAAQQQVEQLGPGGLRVQSDPVLATPAAVAAAMLRSQSDAMAMRAHSEQLPQQQQVQAAMAMGLQRLQAHMQAQAGVVQGQAVPTCRQPQDQLQSQAYTRPDSSMQSHSNSNPLTSSSTAGEQQQEQDVIPAVEDAAGSAFMMQHPMDAVELALAREALAREALMRTAAQSGAEQPTQQELMGLGGIVGDMVFGGAAADDVGRTGPAKRGRHAGDVQAVADPDTQEVLFTTASRDRHKPVARSSGADTLGAVPRPMADFNSLTSEEVAALQQGMDTRTVDDVLGAGMNLTSTFSNALKLGDTDSLEAALLTTGTKPDGSRAFTTRSDSFNRRLEGIMAGINSNELQLPPGGMDSLLDLPSIMQSADLAGAAAAAEQGSEQRSRLASSSR